MENIYQLGHSQQAGKTPGPKQISFWSYIPVVISIGAGVILSFLAFFVVRQDETREMDDAFQRMARQRVFSIKFEARSNQRFLINLRGLFDSSDMVRREQFRTFVLEGMTNIPSYRDLPWSPRAFTWAPYLSAENRPAFEAELKEIKRKLEAERLDKLKRLTAEKAEKLRMAADKSIEQLKLVEKELDGQINQIKTWKIDPNIGLTYTQRNVKYPALDKPDYYPVWYCEPMDYRRASLLGNELGGIPSRRTGLNLIVTAMELSRDTGKMMATLWSRLNMEEGKYGFYFILPVYNKPALELHSDQERRENIKGFLMGTFRIEELIQEALRSFEQAEKDIKKSSGINIKISNYSRIRGARIVFDYPERKFTRVVEPNLITMEETVADYMAQSIDPQPEIETPGFLSYNYQINLLGRRWDVECQPMPEFEARFRTWHPWSVLVMGLLITALVTAYSYGSIGHTMRIENLVHQRTLELKHTNEELAAGIAERKRAEEAVEKLNRELAEKNRELESILYATSHDFRSPLLNIKGFSNELDQACQSLRAQLARADRTSAVDEQTFALLEKGIPQTIQFIKAGVNKMDKLLAGILRLSRQGQAVLSIEVLDMNTMLEQIVNALEFQMKQAEAAISVGNLPACLGDENQINQVFTNLLDNALKYLDKTRPGEIYVNGYIDKQGRVVYCVKDNGIGIAPEQKNKVFEMFYRGDPERSVGDGLGLTITRRIVNRHNGRIWVESTPDQGTEFYVSLPTK